MLVLASLSFACDGFSLYVSAGPFTERTSSPAPAFTPQPIVLGETVNGTFVVPEVCFDLRAPRSGTLFVRISWNRHDGDIDLAFLSIVLPATFTPGPRDTSMVGTMRVVAGQSYRITVVGQQGPVPFTLTTSID